MSSLLKDIYSRSFYNQFADILLPIIPAFEKKQFLSAIFTKAFEEKELKDRMKHTSAVLHRFFDRSFNEVPPLFDQILDAVRKHPLGENSFPFMFLPDYVETYGINDYAHAVKAIESVTQFVSCEFAVRPFILRYNDRMMKQMLTWASHKDHKVRRLASEGSRPRLPWAMALPALKKDPSPVLPILEKLKNDPHEWVRRSVANHLNDIAKDNPKTVIAIARRWKGTSAETDAVIKHGCRTLLKQGDATILALYGLTGKEVALKDLKILTPVTKTGGDLRFVFAVTNNSKKAQVIRLEYAVYYKKQNGSLSKKVFKISERVYEPKEHAVITRKQSFRVITTRKFYPGEHRLSIIINGDEKQMSGFELRD